MRPTAARNRSLLTLAAMLPIAGGIIARRAGAASPSPERVRALTDEILSSPGYEVNPPLSWVIERWLIEQLQRLLEALSLLSRTGPLAGLPQWAWWTIVGASVVLLALILAHLVVTVRGLMSEPRPGRRGARPAAEPPRSPEQALREAEAAAAAGQFALALRRLYEAALRRLDRLDVLRYDPARTNWENLRAAGAGRPGLASMMAPLTAAVDDCVYGDAPATGELFDQCRSLVERIWRAEVATGG